MSLSLRAHRGRAGRGSRTPGDSTPRVSGKIWQKVESARSPGVSASLASLPTPHAPHRTVALLSGPPLPEASLLGRSSALLRCFLDVGVPSPQLVHPPNTYPSLARSCSPSQTLPSLPRPNPTQVSSVGFFGFTVALTDVCQCLPHAVLPGTQSAGW